MEWACPVSYGSLHIYLLHITPLHAYNRSENLGRARQLIWAKFSTGQLTQRTAWKRVLEEEVGYARRPKHTGNCQSLRIDETLPDPSFSQGTPTPPRLSMNHASLSAWVTSEYEKRDFVPSSAAGLARLIPYPTIFAPRAPELRPCLQRCVRHEHLPRSWIVIPGTVHRCRASRAPFTPGENSVDGVLLLGIASRFARSARYRAHVSTGGLVCGPYHRKIIDP